ncbi:rhomboid family intramembrane serine protease [Wenyingzhuangia sp. 2_MG-2023]|uniref:rhomboid family intramembrane serine protease n=1 Tax=Wenyingzhuangia sp. 2_MG-2023 TaxID=3062639 RepID=UPI0026E448DA|nr:rhomboid family intramembrane serine protease [Wenyingzhuangia sp. 2_MG-2023]MDO6738295.1 rhomboid family intramembrane serine protease [Wenyingzhuangia sp. 2_MG-2023]MDO6802221.1 rhomboid family intramembrane serine protease [Wenyingzhuangia sp. 1_MG-2023]
MNQIFSQLKQKYQTGSLVEKLIFVNIIVFILTYFIGGVGSFFYNQNNFFLDWFSLPANLSYFIERPWTVVTYGFLHGDFFHLLFNLIYLFFIGNLFLDYFTPKKLLNFYLMGTIFGGVLFLVSYNYFPALQNTRATLVGASSGIMAILVGLTTYMPNYELKFRFIGFVKLWIVTLIFIGIDLISLSDNNTGGHLAHLGGALYGFLAIYYGTSFKISNPFKKLFQKKSPLKTAYKSKTNKKADTTHDTQQKINVILDKISKSGYESLSKDEKDFLFQQGKK